jgi:glycosyltransferase involved in cell wall biosynthesis
MIFGALTSLPPTPLGETTRGIYGANVAMFTFLKSLLRFGSFDEYHIFISAHDPQKAVESWDKLLRPFDERGRLRLNDLFQLRRFLRERRFTVFHGGHILSNLAYLRAQFSPDRPFPVTGRIDSISYQFLLPDLLMMMLRGDLCPFDAIICTSSQAMRAYETLLRQAAEGFEERYGVKPSFPPKLVHIPLGVDTDQFTPRDKAEARSLLSLPQNGLIILCFGRLSAHEKMDLLPVLRAFKRLMEDHPHQMEEALLLLAGDDARYRYGEKVEGFAREMGISERVRIMRNPSFVETPLIYNASDIFISFSDNFQESFGITVLEAMASGLPVVVSDWDGYRDTVAHGEVGFRVPTYWADCEGRIALYSPVCDWRQEHLYLAQSVCVDQGGMVKYLSELIRNPSLRRDMGDKARRHVLKKYDWRVVIGRYDELWRELWREAESYGELERRKPMFVPDRFESFGGYPTLMLSDQKVVVTEYGRQILSKRLSLKFYKGMKSVLLFPVIQEGLRMADEPIRFEELVDKLMERFKRYSPTREDIRYQLMWMLKHDMIRIHTEVRDG